MNTQIEDFIAYPKRHFSRPDDVLHQPNLTTEEKRKILESWKLDAQRLAESTAENMTGGEESDLRDVSKSLVQLKAQEQLPEAHQPKRTVDLVSGMTIGAFVGAGAGVVISAVTVPSIALVAQGAAAGLIVGGVYAALRKSMR